jgi:hypothetical protein
MGAGSKNKKKIKTGPRLPSLVIVEKSARATAQCKNMSKMEH